MRDESHPSASSNQSIPLTAACSAQHNVKRRDWDSISPDCPALPFSHGHRRHFWLGSPCIAPLTGRLTPQGLTGLPVPVQSLATTPVHPASICSTQKPVRSGSFRQVAVHSAVLPARLSKPSQGEHVGHMKAARRTQSIGRLSILRDVWWLARARPTADASALPQFTKRNQKKNTKRCCVKSTLAILVVSKACFFIHLTALSLFFLGAICPPALLPKRPVINKRSIEGGPVRHGRHTFSRQSITQTRMAACFWWGSGDGFYVRE